MRTANYKKKPDPTDTESKVKVHIYVPVPYQCHFVHPHASEAGQHVVRGGQLVFQGDAHDCSHTFDAVAKLQLLLRSQQKPIVLQKILLKCLYENG